MTLSVALALGSVLVVVAANAYLTQGQFRLTHLQTQIDAQASRRLQLELEVAQLQSPARIVGQALQQGLGAPTKVSTLPLVTVPSHSAKAGSDHSTSPTGDAGVAGAHRPASPTTGKPSSATPSAPSSSPGR